MIRQRAAVVWTVLSGLGFTLAVVLLLLWLAGAFSAKVETTDGESAARTVPAGASVAEVRMLTAPLSESAVGSIQAVRESAVASKILARIDEIPVQAGQHVTAGQVLVRLDDADLVARQQQAEAAARAAEAARDLARTEFDRVSRLLDQQVASKTEFDRAESQLRSAQAELDRAEQLLREARAYLDYATIVSPMDGQVIDKHADAGDMVSPGQTLVTLIDPKQMQLVANVRESLATRLRLSQPIPVRVDALDLDCVGSISEIVPESDVASRSFLVKVTGPCPPGVHSGMFGRLLVPLGEQEVLVAPRAAIRRSGQLELVDVVEGGRLHRRVVRRGREFGEDVEVLSGLRAGERVLVLGGERGG